MAQQISTRSVRFPGAHPLVLSELPTIVVTLVVHIKKAGRGTPHPLHLIPRQLREFDVLRFAMDRGLIRILAWFSGPHTANFIGKPLRSWERYNTVGFANSLDEALLKNESIDDVDLHRLHVELTRTGDMAVTEHLLREQDLPPPTDLITLLVAEERYAIRRKGLREAILHPINPLPKYRAPGAATNAPLRVSEKDVAARWPRRDV